MTSERFKGILSMTDVKSDTLKFSQNSIFMSRKINGLYLLKCNNVDKNKFFFCHTHVQIDYLFFYS